MANSATPAPTQVIKGINQITDERQSVLTDLVGKLQITNIAIEEALKEIVYELHLIRQQLELITDDVIE